MHAQIFSLYIGSLFCAFIVGIVIGPIYNTIYYICLSLSAVLYTVLFKKLFKDKLSIAEVFGYYGIKTKLIINIAIIVFCMSNLLCFLRNRFLCLHIILENNVLLGFILVCIISLSTYLCCYGIRIRAKWNATMGLVFLASIIMFDLYYREQINDYGNQSIVALFSGLYDNTNVFNVILFIFFAPILFPYVFQQIIAWQIEYNTKTLIISMVAFCIIIFLFLTPIILISSQQNGFFGFIKSMDSNLIQKCLVILMFGSSIIPTLSSSINLSSIMISDTIGILRNFEQKSSIRIYAISSVGSHLLYLVFIFHNLMSANFKIDCNYDYIYIIYLTIVLAPFILRNLRNLLKL